MNKPGQNLLEFTIIIALIAVIGIAAYTFLGKNVNSTFTKAHDKYKKFEPFNWSNSNLNNEIKAGEWGGTPDKPVKKCDGTTCSIDFGEFVLTGLPADFNSFVENSGASGASEAIYNALMQIAEQLARNGDKNQAAEIKKLATFGHNTAAIEKSMEDKIKSCNNDVTCVNGFLQTPMPKPSNYNEAYAPFPEKTYEEVLTGLVWARQRKRDDINSFNQFLSAGYSSYQMTDQIDKVLASSSITNAVKGVVRELTWDSLTVAEGFEDNMFYIKSEEANANQQYIDPLTGDAVNNTYTGDPFTNFDSFKASRITDFNSALTCSAGWYQDNGKECH